MTITLRSVKGSPLTHAEMDANFTTLRDTVVAVTGTFSSTLTVSGLISALAGLSIAATTDFDILGSSGTNFARFSYTSAGSTTLFISNATDDAAAEIRLRTRTLGTTLNALILTGTSAILPGTLTVGGAMTLTATATPTGAGAGAVGQIAWDINYLYICTAANDWRRIALVDF